MKFSAAQWAKTPIKNANLPEMRPYITKLAGRICYPREMYFKEVLPLTLKNSVSGKTEKSGGCIFNVLKRIKKNKLFLFN